MDVAAGSRSVKARLLFDSGSERTRISQDLPNKIGAQPFKKELLMSTFGHDKTTKADFETVRTKMLTLCSFLHLRKPHGPESMKFRGELSSMNH